MARKNRTGGRPQARRTPWAGTPKPPKRRPVDLMKLPKIAGRCPGPKRRMRYDNEPDALEALATVRSERLARGHAESAIEKRVYACEITGCGGWHLTSRESFERRPPRSA